MSEKPNSASGASREPQSGRSERPPAEAYQVGPGCPPPDKRWKKGGPSPNPRGRPRKDQSMLQDVRAAFEQALNKKVVVQRGDKKVLMSRVEIGFEQLFNQFAKGDRHARQDLMKYADELGIDFLAKHRQAVEEGLTPNYQAILDAYVARRSDPDTVAPAARVLAAPDLLDDDRAEPEPAPQPPLPEPEPEPPPQPGVKYPKPFRDMTPLARRAWYPEWYEKKDEEEREKARAKEQAKAEAKDNAKGKAAPNLDQASYGYGRPPPGGYSLTTKRWS